MGSRSGILKIGLSMVVLGIIAVAGFWLLRTPQAKPVRIGVVIPLSGSATHLSDIGDGLRMAVDEINALGGISGRPVELILSDSESSPEKGRQVFDRLEAQYQPDLYISITSAVSIPLAPLADRHKVVMVGLGVAAEGFTRINPWLFRYTISGSDEARVASATLQRLAVKNLVIIYQDDPYGESIRQELLRKIDKSAIHAESIPFDAQQPAFKSRDHRIKSSDAVFIIGFGANLKIVISQLKEAGYRGSVTTVSTVAPAPFSEGVYTAAPIVYSPGYPFIDKLKEKHAQQYGKRFTHYVAVGYDFIRLFNGLMEDRSIDRDSIRQALLSGFVHNGVFGNFKVMQGERDIYYPLFPVCIVNGRFEYL